MQTQRINITIPYPILKYLQEAIPFRKRSKFITEAVLEKLGTEKNANQRLKKSLKENKVLYDQTRKDWKITETETWPK